MKKFISSILTRSQKRKQKWISASELKHVVNDNHLIDWLNNHGIKKGFKMDTFKQNQFLMNMGHNFEDKIVKLLEKRLNGKFPIIGRSHLDAINDNLFYKTADLLKAGVPVIYQGVLHNKENNTYGMPDLIVRSDILNDLTDNPSITEEEIYINNRPFYVIVDIKMSTLNLSVDNIHLLNSPKIRAYKSQLTIYNEALNSILGVKAPFAFILGRKWKSSNSSSDNSFDRLGKIDFEGRDKEVIEMTNNGIAELKEIKSDKAADWEIGDNEYLYPNMKSNKDWDYPWISAKSEIAEEIDEITNIYYCGIKNRNMALDNGISKWSDPNCTAELMGIGGNKIAPLVNMFLEVNRSKVPNINFNFGAIWRKPALKECFIDFEFINGIEVEDFSNLPTAKTNNMIYMAGIYYTIDGKNYEFEQITARDLTLTSEFELINKLNKRILEINPERLFHWGNAEPMNYRKSCIRHNMDIIHLNWIDFCKIMKDDMIIIPSMFGFGLKDVAKAMYKNKLIPNYWETELNGSTAMLSTRNAYGAKPELLKEIEEYNKEDCVIMFDIIKYFSSI